MYPQCISIFESRQWWAATTSTASDVCAAAVFINICSQFPQSPFLNLGTADFSVPLSLI